MMLRLLGGRHRPVRRRRVALFLAVVALAVPGLLPARGVAAPPMRPGPSLAQVNAAIELAEGYLDGLYKPLPGGRAVQSEDYGLPLRAYFPAYHRWVLLGQGRAGDCLGGCSGPTTITADASGATTESYTLSFATPSTPAALRVHVVIDWAAAPGRFSLAVSDARLSDPATSAELWLDTVHLADYAPGTAGAPVLRTFRTADRAILRSLRYTVRHATQEAYLYARSRGDHTRAARLAAFLSANGFRPGVDLRAAIFGQGQRLPGDLPFVTAGPDDAYADCDHLPAATPTAYPYTSKVCLLGVDTFLLAGRRDPFLQSTEALQTLTGYADPAHRYPFLIAASLQGATPEQTADHLQQLWGQVGYGIPACTPLGCDTARASGLRTFGFGSLESLLGYRYGQSSRRGYADAVAAQAVAAQVGADGVIRAAGHTWVRPAQAGAFPVYWNAKAQFVPTSGLAESANDMLSMPREYAGAVASDSETTFDGYAFLVTYRCARFGVGCAAAP